MRQVVGGGKPPPYGRNPPITNQRKNVNGLGFGRDGSLPYGMGWITVLRRESKSYLYRRGINHAGGGFLRGRGLIAAPLRPASLVPFLPGQERNIKTHSQNPNAAGTQYAFAGTLDEKEVHYRTGG